ncbi:hypothetical protein GC194_08315 [bacterium]|nr:hypothetical protein [bacterium]
MSKAAALLVILLFAAAYSYAATPPDSIESSLNDHDIFLGQGANFHFRCKSGIDSVKWPLDPARFSFSIEFFDSSGLIKTQNLSKRMVTIYAYRLFANKAGSYALPQATLYSGGQGYKLQINDTLLVRDTLKKPAVEPLGHLLFNFSNPLEMLSDCDPDRICAKIWLTDTSFAKGDTLMLLMAVNRNNAVFKDIKIKHATIINTSNGSFFRSTPNGQSSYMYRKYELVIDKDLRKIKTSTLRVKYQGSTYYFPKLKAKKIR